MKHLLRNALGVLLATSGFIAHASAPCCNHDVGRSNQAWLVAAQREAEADFWMRISRCLADPSGSLVVEMKSACVELRDARIRATAIFQARGEANALFGHAAYSPQIDPGEFSTAITNPYFPQIPGRRLVHERHTAAGLERIETSALAETKLVGGVQCRLVREREVLAGELIEDTYNWVAQHESGAVWYFGELAMEFEDETLDSLEGSWRFGEDGAQPGILMQAAPALGDVYRQEFLLGNAEDIARVVRLDVTVDVPAGTFEHCVEILEWDPLEPLEYLLKFFAPGVGMVLEIDTRTGERSELVEFH